MALETHFARHGIVIVEYALQLTDLDRMADAFVATTGRGGARHADLPPDLIAWLGQHPVLTDLATLFARAPTRLVRIVAFDKTPNANWFVPWHQDCTIAVDRRADVGGYRNWTSQNERLQVEPPVATLDGMVTLRIHLDDCDEDNGPLEVVPGSHLGGRLNRAAIATLCELAPHKLCLAARGDILAMRPLLVHRSQKAKAPARRRVLHLEYASTALATEFEWALAAPQARQ